MRSTELKILWVNCYCSDDVFDSLFKIMENKPEVSIQHFMDLLYGGFVQNDVIVTTLSERQIEGRVKLYWPYYRDKDKYGYQIFYTPILCIPIINQIYRLLFNFLFVFNRFLFHSKPQFVICDAMRFYTSFPSLIVSKIFGIKCIAYVADIPQMYKHQLSTKLGVVKTFLKRLYSKLIVNYDGYILLSPYMNSYVNPKNKPSIIVEGLVGDNNLNKPESYQKKVQDGVTTIMYSGGLYKKYGVKILIDAFHQISQKNISLWLFGHGDLDDYIKELNDDRIKFWGYVPHDIVEQKQREADFLINPRPSDEEYTKYSFPSKIMEYMISGKPVISTKLLSIPQDYFKYIIPIEKEDVDGIKKTLENVILMPVEDRERIGSQSASFVLKNKTNVIQAKRILLWADQYFVK